MQPDVGRRRGCPRVAASQVFVGLPLSAYLFGPVGPKLFREHNAMWALTESAIRYASR